VEHAILIVTLILCTIAGLIFGPGYMLYCVYFSGRRVSENVVFKRHGTEPNPACVPVRLRLAPEMNPIEIRYVVRYQPSEQNLPGERFQLRMLPPQGETPAWTCSAPRPSKDEAGRSCFGRVARFSVSEAGMYRIDVSRGVEPALPAARVKIDIRRNVKKMQSSIVLGGVFMLVGSLIAVPIVTPPAVIQENVAGAADASPTSATQPSAESASEPQGQAAAEGAHSQAGGVH
jgi:hypothetical protein